MKTNEILVAVCNAIQLNTDMIEELSTRFEVVLTQEQIERALGYCKSRGDLSALGTILVRSIYFTVVERYKDDFDEKKFVWKPDGNEPYIEYDGQRIVSNMQLRGMVREKKEREQYEARKAKEDSYRQQLTGKLDCEEKTISNGDVTVVARKTDKPEGFMCKILVGDKEAGCLELDTDLLLTLLMDCKKKTE